MINGSALTRTPNPTRPTRQDIVLKPVLLTLSHLLLSANLGYTNGIIIIIIRLRGNVNLRRKYIQTVYLYGPFMTEAIITQISSTTHLPYEMNDRQISMTTCYAPVVCTHYHWCGSWYTDGGR